MVRTMYKITLKDDTKIVLASFCRTLLNDPKISSHYYSWFSNPEVTKYNSHGLFPKSKEEMNYFLDGLDKSNTNMLCYAILVDHTDSLKKDSAFSYTHIGNASLQAINWVNRSAELAIVIGETEFYGKGIGKAVCNKLLKHGFEKLNLHKIWTGTASTNSGMRTIASRIGMVAEGNFRDGMFLNGEYVVISCYGILSEDYFTFHRRAEDPETEKVLLEKEIKRIDALKNNQEGETFEEEYVDPRKSSRKTL